MDGFSEIWNGEIYLDSELAFFKALGDGEPVFRNVPTDSEFTAKLEKAREVYGGESAKAKEKEIVGGAMVIGLGTPEYSHLLVYPEVRRKRVREMCETNC